MASEYTTVQCNACGEQYPLRGGHKCAAVMTEERVRELAREEDRRFHDDDEFCYLNAEKFIKQQARDEALEEAAKRLEGHGMKGSAIEVRCMKSNPASSGGAQARAAEDKVGAIERHNLDWKSEADRLRRELDAAKQQSEDHWTVAGKLEAERDGLRRELEEARHEAWSQKNRADVHADTNDNLRAALECFGCSVDHEVVEHAKRIACEIATLRASAASLSAEADALRHHLMELEGNASGWKATAAWNSIRISNPAQKRERNKVTRSSRKQGRKRG